MPGSRSRSRGRGRSRSRSARGDVGAKGGKKHDGHGGGRVEEVSKMAKDGSSESDIVNVAIKQLPQKIRERLEKLFDEGLLKENDLDLRSITVFASLNEGLQDRVMTHMENERIYVANARSKSGFLIATCDKAKTGCLDARGLGAIDPWRSALVAMATPKPRLLDLTAEGDWLEKHGADPVKIHINIAVVEREVGTGRVTVELPLSESSAAVKSKLSAMGIQTIPVNKMMLHVDPVGFLKDRHSLAYYNLVDGTELELSIRQRAGTKLRKDHAVPLKRPKTQDRQTTMSSLDAIQKTEMPKLPALPAPGPDPRALMNINPPKAGEGGHPDLAAVLAAAKAGTGPGLPGLPGLSGLPSLPGLPSLGGLQMHGAPAPNPAAAKPPGIPGMPGMSLPFSMPGMSGPMAAGGFSMPGAGGMSLTPPGMMPGAGGLPPGMMPPGMGGLMGGTMPGLGLNPHPQMQMGGPIPKAGGAETPAAAAPPPMAKLQAAPLADTPAPAPAPQPSVNPGMQAMTAMAGLMGGGGMAKMAAPAPKLQGNALLAPTAPGAPVLAKQQSPDMAPVLSKMPAMMPGLGPIPVANSTTKAGAPMGAPPMGGPPMGVSPMGATPKGGGPPPVTAP